MIRSIIPTGNLAKGPLLAMNAVYEETKADPEFLWMRAPEFRWGGGEDVCWIWGAQHAPIALQALAAKRPVAIGPYTIFRKFSAIPSTPHERKLIARVSYTAIFHPGHWRREWALRFFKQQQGHWVLNMPVADDVWKSPWEKEIVYDALIYVKQGESQTSIAAELAKRYASDKVNVLTYGGYKRENLLNLSAQSAVCYYLARNDSGPAAAKEIMAMGCPIVSHDRAVPQMLDGVTGTYVACRTPSDPTKKWELDKGNVEDLFRASLPWDGKGRDKNWRNMIRLCIREQISPKNVVSRIKAALRSNDDGNIGADESTELSLSASNG